MTSFIDPERLKPLLGPISAAAPENLLLRIYLQIHSSTLSQQNIELPKPGD